MRPMVDLTAMQEEFELGSEIEGIVLATASEQAVEVVHVQDDGCARVVRGAQCLEHQVQTVLDDVASPPSCTLPHVPLKRIRKRRIALEVLEAARLGVSCPNVRPPVIERSYIDTVHNGS